METYRSAPAASWTGIGFQAPDLRGSRTTRSQERPANCGFSLAGLVLRQVNPLLKLATPSLYVAAASGRSHQGSDLRGSRCRFCDVCRRRSRGSHRRADSQHVRDPTGYTNHLVGDIHGRGRGPLSSDKHAFSTDDAKRCSVDADHIGADVDCAARSRRGAGRHGESTRDTNSKGAGGRSCLERSEPGYCARSARCEHCHFCCYALGSREDRTGGGGVRREHRQDDRFDGGRRHERSNELSLSDGRPNDRCRLRDGRKDDLDRLHH